MRKHFFALLFLCAFISAGAQPPAAPATSMPKRALCADCGVITSVRSVSKQEAAAAAPARNPSNEAPPGTVDETKPPGLVASIPLDGGKPKVGSATRVGNDAPSVTTTWEVIVRLDDGQFRILSLDSQPDFAKGDRVRVVNGKLALPP